MSRSLFPESPKVLFFATFGVGSYDDLRIRTLLEGFRTLHYPFKRENKILSAYALLVRIKSEQPDLIVMEGTGIAGGLVLILCKIFWNIPYVVSSGDAVGPYFKSRTFLLYPLFLVYEILLSRFCAGFIGWTPYLVGRALTFGAPRAMTAEGWAEFRTDSKETPEQQRQTIRNAMAIQPDEILVGIVGSLDWNSKKGFCYGYDLVKALILTTNPKIKILIVGNGSGLKRLRALASQVDPSRLIFTGKVPPEKVPGYLYAMDVGSLPQSCDGLGSFRYTIKISEYLKAGLPVVTNQIPMAYDLGEGWSWRIAGDAPWEKKSIEALARFFNDLALSEVLEKKKRALESKPVFEKDSQIDRVKAFVSDLLADFKGEN